MRSLLLVLGAALACGLQAVDIPQPLAELNLEKVAGTWHTMAMAANALGLLEPEDAPLRVYIKEVRPMSTGGLEITLSRQENHDCVETTITAQKTQDPTVFTVNYQGERRLSVLDTDYDGFVFFCLEAAQSRVACQYLARTPQADPEVMEKFNLALKMLPLHVRIFLDLTQGAERCRV